jgi:Poly(A) polymerase catalytic subunit
MNIYDELVGDGYNEEDNPTGSCTIGAGVDVADVVTTTDVVTTEPTADPISQLPTGDNLLGQTINPDDRVNENLTEDSERVGSESIGSESVGKVSKGDDSTNKIATPDNLKDYENIALRHDPVYIGVEKVVDVLKEFIVKHGLIIYGGLAIDYALRMHDDRLYPDDLLQVDYDFFSPDNVHHAYQLANIFYKVVSDMTTAEDAEGVRAINATHVKTLRVDIRDNHFLADLSYVPADLFPLLPTLEYDGIKFIHPDYQRTDIHHSLAFPYQNAPMEVISNRWKKDLTRFNMLVKYYPIEYTDLSTVKQGGAKKVVSTSYAKYILGGFHAYKIMYLEVGKHNGNLPTDILPPLEDTPVEILHMNLDKCIEEIAGTHVKKYHHVLGLFPETAYCMTENGPARIYSMEDDLVSVVSVQGDSSSQRIACAQHVLYTFLSNYHVAKMLEKIPDDKIPRYRPDYPADVYLNYYVSMMKLMEYDHKVSAVPVTRLSVETYGGDNVSLSKKIAITRVYADINHDQTLYLPMSYYPARGNPPPVYDYKLSDLFKESGEIFSI